MTDAARDRAAGLSCWTGPVAPEPLAGGITNTNFVVRDGGAAYVVRIGADIPEHLVMRFAELAASRAAHAAGISPEVVHAEPGAMVLRFVAGRTWRPADVRGPDALEHLVPLIRRVHLGIPEHLAGAALVFWVFQVLRHYRRTLKAGHSRMVPELARLEAVADGLEAAVGPIRLVFGHNDLLAANFIQAPDRLWLVDWDYAGFNSPLFDLANLASNNKFPPALERALLEAYFEAPVRGELWHRYTAMKCASLLREAMWSMVSEIHSRLDFDYVAYTTKNLARFERAFADFQRL